MRALFSRRELHSCTQSRQQSENPSRVICGGEHRVVEGIGSEDTVSHAAKYGVLSCTITLASHIQLLHSHSHSHSRPIASKSTKERREHSVPVLLHCNTLRTMALAGLNRAAASPDAQQPGSALYQSLLYCCGSRTWVDKLLQRFPFADFEALCQASNDVEKELSREDWLEAFGAHPRVRARSSLRVARSFGYSVTPDVRMNELTRSLDL